MTLNACYGRSVSNAAWPRRVGVADKVVVE